MGKAFNLFTLILAAVTCIASAASAQPSEWIYVGPSDLFSDPAAFTTAADFDGARACVVEGWAPINSGIPEITQLWEIRPFDPAAAYDTISTNGLCDVIALPANAFADNARLLELALSRAMVDLTSALLAAEGR